MQPLIYLIIFWRRLVPGWPDEFVKNIAQNVVQYILVDINALNYG
jgi:hypothetical protein